MANLALGVDLGVNDLSDVLELLQKCGFPETRWYELGLKLGLRKNTLDIIDKNNPRDVSRCLIECLSKWLCRADDVDSKGGATTDSLINALKSMDENAVASAVRLITLSAPAATQGCPPLSPIVLKDIPDDRPKVSELINFYKILKLLIEGQQDESIRLLDANTIGKIKNAVNDYEKMSLLIRAIDELLNKMRANRIIKSSSQKSVEAPPSPALEPQIPSLTTQPPVTTPICKPNHSSQILPSQSQLMHVEPHSYSTTIQLSSKEDVARNIELLHHQFTSLVSKIRKLFKGLASNKKLDADDVQFHAEQFLGQDFELPETSIHAIFNAIRPHNVFFSFELLKSLALRFIPESNNLRTELNQYIDRVDKFLESSQLKYIRSTINLLNDKLPSRPAAAPPTTTNQTKLVVIKLNDGWNDMTISKLKTLLEHYFGSESNLFSYIKFEKGSVVVTLLIPASLSQSLIIKINQKAESMSRLGIFAIAVDKNIISIRKEDDNNFDISLRQSVIAGDIFEVSMLLQLGADPNSKDESGKSAIEIANEGGNTQIKEILLTDRGTQLLKLFKDANHEDAVRLLPYIENLKHLRDEVTIKISPFDAYQVKASLLHMALWNGWLDVAGDLITKYDCDPEERDSKGNTCLHYAAMGNHLEVMVHLIQKFSCDPMATNENGDTVPHKAAYYGSLEVMKNFRCNPKSTNKKGETLLHCAVEHVDILKYLIDECSCDPMANTSDGRTPLHYAANFGCFASVEFLLSTGKCDPLAKDKYRKTPLRLAKERQQKGGTNTLPIFKKFGDIKSSHPIDSYVNVLLVGNPGAGKSTLSHVINDTATFTLLGSFRNVKGVVPCTAGIIPYKVQHRTLDNIILHDFAGHSEYYSSHSAVIENLLQGSGGVFLIVVNILEKEPVKQLHQWLTVVRNEAQKALYQCHVIVIVSHVDEISNPFERRRRKEEIQEIIVRERCDSVFLDCRKLGGSGVDSFFNKLSSACESIRSTSGRNLSLYCHMMYGLLEERKENILTLSDVMSAGEDNDDYVLPDKREDVLDLLHSLHSTGLISVLESKDKVWVVVNKGILLTEVDGILFAPETFKEHVDIASNTGIISVSGLTRLFPKYDPDMLICFLKNMELCQELEPSFLRMTNLHQLAVEEEKEGGTERRGERLLFFPCLLSTDRPDEMTSEVYQFGWCLQCTSKHHFFPPRYFHVLSLHLAYKMALPQEDDKLNRYCTFWKNGLYWFNGHGVGSLVEIVDESQCVLVMMSCEKGYSDNMVSPRRDVIGEVMSVYKEFCPSLEVKELVMDPEELAYPVNTPRERTVYDVKGILSAIIEGKKILVSDKGDKEKELKRILNDESVSDISNLSLLGTRDIKVSEILIL